MLRVSELALCGSGFDLTAAASGTFGALSSSAASAAESR